MAIRDWHWGKIVLVWVAVWILLFVLKAYLETILIVLFDIINPMYTDFKATLIWLVVAVLPASIVTWRWLSGREANQ